MTTLALMLILGSSVVAETSKNTPAATPAEAPVETAVEPGGDVKTFLSGIVGEWVGTCEQSTDGEQAENKYIHAVVREQEDGSIEGRFNYYRFDEATGEPLPIGETTIVTSVGEDGTATSEITGKGVVMVNEKPKNQEHKLTETIVSSGSNGVMSKGTGTISVSGMPLGLGKNGKVKDSVSTWSMKDGVLYIDQKLRVGFRALIFTKNFDIEARYVVRRGTDVAALMRESMQASAAKPAAR